MSFSELVDPENGGLAVGISFLFCVEAEIISGNLVYPRFSKVLPVYGRHIGYPVMDKSEIFTSSCTANVFRKSHQSTLVNSSWLRNSITRFGPGVFPLLAH